LVLFSIGSGKLKTHPKEVFSIEAGRITQHLQGH